MRDAALVSTGLLACLSSAHALATTIQQQTAAARFATLADAQSRALQPAARCRVRSRAQLGASSQARSRPLNSRDVIAAALRASSLAAPYPQDESTPQQASPLQPNTPAESQLAVAPKTPRYGPHVKVKGYALNLIGLMFTIVSFASAFAWYPLLVASYGYCRAFQKQTMRSVDWVVHWWAKTSMLLMTYRPVVVGREHLPPKGEAVMYIPNHCSYFDIMTMSGFLPRPIKYISKADILKIPFIGWAMKMAHHITITRTDRRSQLQTFKDAVSSLKRGNSIVAFAEGTRSLDGRLKPFKKGPIAMAMKAGVRIVPVSLVNTHVMMPPDCLMPVGVPRNVEIRVHAPVTTVGKTEEEVLKQVRDAVADGLPSWQKPKDATPASSEGAISG